MMNIFPLLTMLAFRFVVFTLLHVSHWRNSRAAAVDRNLNTCFISYVYNNLSEFEFLQSSIAFVWFRFKLEQHIFYISPAYNKQASTWANSNNRRIFSSNPMKERAEIFRCEIKFSSTRQQNSYAWWWYCITSIDSCCWAYYIKWNKLALITARVCCCSLLSSRSFRSQFSLFTFTSIECNCCCSVELWALFPLPPSRHPCIFTYSLFYCESVHMR